MGAGELSASLFSHNEADYIPDPFPFYSKMRERQPAFFSERIFGGSWLFFTHGDCRRLMLNEQLSNARSTLPLWFLDEDDRAEFDDMVTVFDRWMAFHDGGSHRRLRRHVDASYEPYTDEVLAPHIQKIVDGLLDRVGGEFDLMEDFATPLPSMVLAHLLGVSVDAHGDLTRWTDDIAHLFGSTEVTVEDLRRTRRSTHELMSFLAAEAASGAPGDGMLQRLRAAPADGGPVDDLDAVAQAALLLFAGLAATRYLIGNAVHAIDARADQRPELFLDDDTAGHAVEEVLRFCTPVQFVGRVAGRDLRFTPEGGTEVLIRGGQPILLYVASANRDPLVFADPEDLRLDRPGPIRHLTFGAGRHLCVGDPLVRLIVRLALGALYRRFTTLRLPEQRLDWNNNLGFHGVQSLRVTTR